MSSGTLGKEGTEAQAEQVSEQALEGKYQQLPW